MSKIKIKKVPSWVVILKILPNNISIGFSPFIFLNKKLYENYKTGSLNCDTEAMIAHESTHVVRQQKIGLWKFLFLYCFSNKFCFKEEIEAIKEEMKVYKLHGKQYDIERRARVLSSFWLYHNCINYEEAKKSLDALWHQT